MERCPRTRDYGNRSKSAGVGVRQLAAALVNDRLFQGASKLAHSKAPFGRIRILIPGSFHYSGSGCEVGLSEAMV